MVTSMKKILVLDVHASEGGALSILDDFYEQVIQNGSDHIQWIFLVSTPEYLDTKFIKSYRFPWIKKSWLHRLIFDNCFLPIFVRKADPDLILNLQNKAYRFRKVPEIVYLHLPFILTKHRFRLFRDEFKLWFYQKIYKAVIFKSYKNVGKIVVQTKWMKDELIRQAQIDQDRVAIVQPKLALKFEWGEEFLKSDLTEIFYPATGFSYKNHMIILKAMKDLKKIKEYSAYFTIDPNENKYARTLSDYSKKHGLNVNFLGSINRDEVIKRLRSGFLVFPSFIESFGLPLLEAKVLGVPIVAIDAPFSREILNDYERVSFFDGNDHCDLVTTLLEFRPNDKKLTNSDECPSNISLMDLILHNQDD